jgi:hypothetical protein
MNPADLEDVGAGVPVRQLGVRDGYNALVSMTEGRKAGRHGARILNFMLERSVNQPLTWQQRIAREWLWLCVGVVLGLLYWRYTLAINGWEFPVVIFAALIWGLLAYLALGVVRLTAWAIRTAIR